MCDSTHGTHPTAAISVDVKAREALIVEQPPRILPVYSEAVISAAQEHTAKRRGTSASTSVSVAVADIPEMVVTLLGCHADLYEKVADVSVQLMAKTSLPRRDLELVVLRAR